MPTYFEKVICTAGCGKALTRYVPEQRKRLYCVAEITLSTTFLFASEVPAIAAFARSGLQPNTILKSATSKTLQRGTIDLESVPRSRFGLPKCYKANGGWLRLAAHKTKKVLLTWFAFCEFSVC